MQCFSISNLVRSMLILALSGCAAETDPSGPHSSGRADQASSLSLSGAMFSRTFMTDGFLGQPRGEFTHYLAFSEDSVEDNAGSAFGNPPESRSYAIVDDLLLVETDGDETEYEISADGRTLTMIETGAVLTRIDVVDATFSRTVQSNGGLGQPPGTRKHSLQFTATTVRDNASTFFGNPPRVLDYSLDRDRLTVQNGDNETLYRLSRDGKTLTLVETGATLTRE